MMVWQYHNKHAVKALLPAGPSPDSVISNLPVRQKEPLQRFRRTIRQDFPQFPVWQNVSGAAWLAEEDSLRFSLSNHATTILAIKSQILQCIYNVS